MHDHAHSDPLASPSINTSSPASPPIAAIGRGSPAFKAETAPRFPAPVARTRICCARLSARALRLTLSGGGFTLSGGFWPAGVEGGDEGGDIYLPLIVRNESAQ